MGAIGVELREVTPVHPDNEVGGCTRPLVETAPEESPAEDTGKAVSAKVTKVKPTRNCRKKKCPKAEETAVLISQVVVSGEDSLGDTAIAAEETKIRPEKPIFVPGTGTEPIEEVVTPDYKGDGSDEPKEAVDSEYERVIPVCPGHPIPEPLFVSIVDRVWVSLVNNTDKPNVLINLAHIPDIPYSKVLDTPDLSQYITRTVNDLVYYYTKSDTYTKEEVNQLISGIHGTEYARELLDADDLFFKLPNDPGTDVTVYVDPGVTGTVLWGAESEGQVALSVNGASKTLLKSAALTPLDTRITALEASVVKGISLGGTAYSPVNGVVSLPAYPTTLPASDVYPWAKQSTKPSYAFSEITGVASVSQIPSLTISKISDAESWLASKGYVTRLVNDLANYYLKSETYTKSEVDALIGSIAGFTFEIYPTLPATGQSNVLYLIGPIGTSDVYDEYVYTNNTWTRIGSTSIDLSGYVQNTRTITAGTGLTGGGDLSADRTIALSSATIASLALADTAYQKPGTGIPSTDLASAVQASLGLADSALQSADLDGYVNEIETGSGNYISGVSKSGKKLTFTYGTLPTTIALSNVTGAADLQAIEALTGTGLLKRTGENTWSFDTNSYALASDLSAVSGRVTTLEGRTNWDNYFGIDANGNVYVKMIDENTARDFYSYGAVTAGGVGSGGGGGSIDLDRVWESLSTNTDSFGAVTIHPDHIPNIALSTITGADDLKAIEALTGTSGLLRKTAANTWALDTAAYLTQNETITLLGDVTGSGRTSITTTIGEGRVTNAMLAGGITNAKLANSGVTIGSATVALGGTKTLTEIGIPTWAQASSLAFSSLPAMYIGNARVQGSAQTAQDVGGIGNLTAQRLYLADGVYLYYDSENEGIKVVGAGLYSESYLTAYGVNGSGGGGGGGGIDLARVWQSLTTNTDAFGSSIIHSDHIPDYERLSFVKLNEGTDVTIYVDPGVTGTALWGVETQTLVDLNVNGAQKTLVKSSALTPINSSISTLQGYFSNGVANNAAALNGHADSYFATSVALNNLALTVATKVASIKREGDIDAYTPDGNGLVTIPAYPTTLPASDVYAWAKKQLMDVNDVPGLPWSKITSGTPTTIAGYGITDARISNGTIYLGNEYITPVTSLAGYATENYVNTRGFITKTVNDLTNYYLKSETYTQAEVNALIAAIDQFHYEIYASISLVTDPQSNVLYLIGPKSVSGNDKYDEYVYTTEWVKIGETSIDLSGYLTIDAAAQTYQPLDDDLTEIASKTGAGLLRRGYNDHWSLDTNDYLTTHQTIYSLLVKNFEGTSLLSYNPATAAAEISLTKAMVGLGNVENQALSSWTGATSINTLGTITTGEWHGTVIANDYLANKTIGVGGATITLGSSATLSQIGVAQWAQTQNSTIDFSALPALYIGTTQVQSSSAVQNLTGIGSISASGALTLSTTKRIYFGDTNHYLELDSNGFHFSHGVYSDDFVTAYGIGSSGGGSGVDLPRVWQSLTNSVSPVTPDANTKIAVAHIPDITTAKVSDIETWIAGKGYITGITSSMVTTALGYTPFDSADFTQSEIQQELGISNWALAANAPTYAFGDLTSHPTTLAGYEISDANITNGVITLGSNSISSQSAASGGTTASLVTTGEKYTWNSKANAGGSLSQAFSVLTLSVNVADENPILLSGADEGLFVGNVLIPKTNSADTAALLSDIPGSLSPAQGGTSLSLVTTGEKYNWNAKYDKPSGGIPNTDLALDMSWVYLKNSGTYNDNDFVIINAS